MRKIKEAAGPRTVAHHLGWAILEEDGRFWVPCAGTVTDAGIIYPFNDDYDTLAGAIAAIGALGKTCAEVQF